MNDTIVDLDKLKVALVDTVLKDLIDKLRKIAPSNQDDRAMTTDDSVELIRMLIAASTLGDLIRVWIIFKAPSPTVSYLEMILQDLGDTVAEVHDA